MVVALVPLLTRLMDSNEDHRLVAVNEQLT